MYSISALGDMIADETRTDAYVAALQRAVRVDSVVLDIGTGTGIFALLASRGGARHVYAVEPSDAIHIARKIAQENGYADQITFIQGLSTQITLPERVDVVISDLHGVLPFFHTHIPSIVDARQRHLAPGGMLIPQQDSLWAVVVSAPEDYEATIQPWIDNKYNLKMESARQVVTNLWNRGRVKPAQFLVEPQSWATLDYRTVTSPDVCATLLWTVQQAGLAHGLSLWFDTGVAPGISLSNAPGVSELVYGNAFFPWTNPVSLAGGDEIKVRLQANLIGDDYVWRWETQIWGPPGAHQVKARFKQSSVHGSLFSPAQLSKGAADYVSQLSEEGEIDRCVLRMMDGTTSLGVIADALVQEFPGHFSRRSDALGRVADLSRRYSR
ncbi:MAG TPA: class I SAM-dependent methyltransferase [Caldilineaceae bacterium]|nr:class I SAM-dependent methyltransferase [Caldilineaceae bacterium]